MTGKKDELKTDEEPKSVSQQIDYYSRESVSIESVKRTDAFSKIDRQISESDLQDSGTMRWLLNEHDQYEGCRKELDEYKAKYYDCDKRCAISEEKLKTNTVFEVLYSTTLSAGSALMGVSPSISDDSGVIKYIVIAVGIILFMSGVISKIVINRK